MDQGVGAEVFIPLRHGPVVPVSVVSWLIDAEFRGLRFRATQDGQLQVGPPAVVTTDDLVFVRQHRNAVLACVRYIDEVVA